MKPVWPWSEALAEKVKKHIPVEDIDVVIPIPDSSRPSAMQLAQALGIPFREGFSRTATSAGPSSCPGSRCTKKSVRQKLNGQEFKGKRVLLVDDSIVRGTTSREIVEMARGGRGGQGLFRFRRATGTLPECLASTCRPARTDCHRPVMARASPAKSGPMRWSILDALKDSVTKLRADGLVRCLLFRWLLHHRRYRRVLPRCRRRQAGGKAGKNDDDGDGNAAQQLVLRLASEAQD